MHSPTVMATLAVSAECGKSPNSDAFFSAVCAM